MKLTNCAADWPNELDGARMFHRGDSCQKFAAAERVALPNDSNPFRMIELLRLRHVKLSGPPSLSP